MPTAATTIPVGTSGLGPKRGSSLLFASTEVRERIATIGRNAKPGADGGVAERDLQVIGQEQEHAEQRGDDQEDREIRTTAIPVDDNPQREQRMCDATFDGDEGSKEYDPANEKSERDRVLPTGGVGVREAVHDCEQPGGYGERPWEVDLRAVFGARLLQQDGTTDEGDRGEDGIDEERPAPRRVRCENASEDEADGAASAEDRAVDAERPAALGRIGERRGQQGQDRRREQRSERPLAAHGPQRASRSLSRRRRAPMRRRSRPGRRGTCACARTHPTIDHRAGGGHRTRARTR